ncbi:Asp-tRNA(Asn)/Glu-tRNA(Gln) amidotransferase subunit GatA [Bordetella holmesii]|uniref:Glutamyl-tRNA(Gln) amidotransferase subunit A n=2 Tax=Bordetella holmesii TaxID=35814 RepID=A0A158M8G7_9BORD|nr:Asp-tRNA(Asn)/Glu-tRNA(Gln) amidotransferase subunit GatA [Bordetella holmesii]AHV93450.1 aspartyl/glutamyl-tRNA(Asn/Gln) amidotransferase, A subunit [Bordetella holmesii ATCC 51541]AIT26461.1 aspartyl/glutamyl-tRNA(Asn/Gln) amidotransferase, A subunit [Bordetella holmesii 44057]EWM44173.1 aspartyl/glutamyl-tRNA(Asn/Gln) amidotransferase, A subunit [Bordetella holmesii 41130]EWM47034.1 aspartyl/glutamyl-tRNA(Asn/Gln) amidotransferase, A subunit [Bordetella holmesii 35009]EWM51203.1 aspartyl
MSHSHTEFGDIAGLRTALAERRVSAVELAQEGLARAAAADLNAFLHIDTELTLAQAKAADAALAAGTAGPLAGIPIAHKDAFVTRGWRSTAGSKMLDGYVSPFDATVVERLQAAGAVSLGKLNCDEFAMGSGNENSAYGPARNPWDHQAVPGGSSGGSAVAVAARLVAAATGTDTGGSVRQPAALCGVSGIKPTYGTVSRYGIIAFGSSLDQAGPLAASSRDLLELLDVMSGYDERDATSLEHCDGVKNAPGRVRAAYDSTQQSYQAAGSLPLKGLRIGVPAEFFGAGLAPEVAAAIEAALQRFEALGAERVAISLPRTELSIPAYYVIAPAEASSNLARFDGVRYGHRAAQYSDLNDMISRSRAEGFGDEVKRRILIGTYVLSHGYYDAYYLQAQRLRRLIAQDFQRAFATQCDVIMGPVAPGVAKNIGENRDDPTADWLADIYTLGVSLAGLPAMSVPCGFGSTGRPVGLQIIGNYFDEGRLLAIADRYQQVTDWHQRTPATQDA